MKLNDVYMINSQIGGRTFGFNTLPQGNTYYIYNRRYISARDEGCNAIYIDLGDNRLIISPCLRPQLKILYENYPQG